MIIWRDGVGAFKGAAKRLINGVFSYRYSITTATVVPTEVRTYGLTSTITATYGTDSTITATQGHISPITATLGVHST